LDRPPPFSLGASAVRVDACDVDGRWSVLVPLTNTKVYAASQVIVVIIIIAAAIVAP
jgi:hypothetical protein